MDVSHLSSSQQTFIRPLTGPQGQLAPVVDQDAAPPPVPESSRFSPSETPVGVVPPLASEAIGHLIESVRSYRAGFPPEALRPEPPGASAAEPPAPGAAATRADAGVQTDETTRADDATRPEPALAARPERPEAPALPGPRPADEAAVLAETEREPAPPPTGTLPGDDAGSILDVTG